MQVKHKRINLYKYRRKDCPYCKTIFKGDLTPYVWNPDFESDLTLPDHIAFSRAITFGPGGIAMKARIRAYQCPKCSKPIIDLLAFWSNEKDYAEPPEIIPIYPSTEPDPKISKHIPFSVRQDFIEAFRVRKVSLKASATLARRCLQNTLRHAFPEMETKLGWLSQEIRWVEDNHKLDSDIIDALNALKEAGNFSAHPEKEGELQTIYELSPEDLDACFSVLEELFDECFVKPAEKKERRERLKRKFSKLEKKKIKGTKK